MRKGAFQEVMADALMGALVSSRKDFLSSLQKKKHSSSTQLGKGEVDMATWK